MKAKDKTTGTFKEVYVRALDSFPIGTVVEYEGSSADIPAGWQSYSTGKIKKTTEVGARNSKFVVDNTTLSDNTIQTYSGRIIDSKFGTGYQEQTITETDGSNREYNITFKRAGRVVTVDFESASSSFPGTASTAGTAALIDIAIPSFAKIKTPTSANYDIFNISRTDFGLVNGELLRYYDLALTAKTDGNYNLLLNFRVATSGKLKLHTSYITDAD